MLTAASASHGLRFLDAHEDALESYQLHLKHMEVSKDHQGAPRKTVGWPLSGGNRAICHPIAPCPWINSNWYICGMDSQQLQDEEEE
jgi:hypothetical protein